MQFQEIVERISSMPAVAAVGATGQMPLAGQGSNGQFAIEGGKNSGNYWPTYRVATPGYFEVMGSLLFGAGCSMNPTDHRRPKSPSSSQSVANAVWPGENPIGKRINFRNMDRDEEFMTLVGIVSDVRDERRKVSWPGGHPRG